MQRKLVICLSKLEIKCHTSLSCLVQGSKKSIELDYESANSSNLDESSSPKWLDYKEKLRVRNLSSFSSKGETPSENNNNQKMHCGDTQKKSPAFSETAGIKSVVTAQTAAASPTLHASTDQKWIELEISKLSERVKKLGGVNYYRLVVFIKLNLPSETEDCIVNAVESVKEAHGTLNGLSRNTILSEVTNLINEKR